MEYTTEIYLILIGLNKIINCLKYTPKLKAANIKFAGFNEEFMPLKKLKEEIADNLNSHRNCHKYVSRGKKFAQV